MSPPGPTAGSGSFRGEIPGVSNVLLLASPLHRADLEACLDLLTITEPDNEHVWSLGITLSPNDRVENWEEFVGRSPAAFKIISVGEQPQERAKEVAADYGFDPEPNFVTVPSGGALMSIGIELTDVLDDWAEADAETVICFHSVSALLQYRSEERAFQFLDEFTSQVEQAGALAHYHMDPRVHGDATISEAKQLVDAVVEPEGDDEYRLVKG